MTSASPVRIAIANDYALVVAGIAAVLAPYSERVQVVELDSQLPVVSEVDVLLYDTFAQVQGDTMDIDRLTTGETSPRIVVFSWNVEPALIDRAMRHGAAGYLSKGLSAIELVDAIEKVHAGEVVRGGPDLEDQEPLGRWPGDKEGLSARESEVLALITQGMSNQEIADQCFLSINSVKTYIRTAYRKMDVTRRSQAVLWGLDHGFAPDRVRMLPRG